MAVISETSDDFHGSDQDPNKEAQQLQKKPDKVEKDTTFPFPEDVTITCFTLVGIFHYPNLSLVSKTIYRHITTPYLYNTRSQLGRTESVLYACVGFTRFQSPSWYILHRKPYRNVRDKFSLQLQKIGSFPPMPWGPTVVTVGYEMYVIGGCVGEDRTKDVILIDCRRNTYSSLPSMLVARCRAAAVVINGKIFVAGGCPINTQDNCVEAIDLKNKTWVSFKWPGQPIREVVTYAVMEEKIYVLDKKKCYAYDLKGDEWDLLVVGDLSVLWHESSCVIDDMLFSVNPKLMFGGLLHLTGYPIIVYDPKEKNWRPLYGLQGFPGNIVLEESKMVNSGGKLVIFATDRSRFTDYKGKQEIWFVEIALERRQGGEIWGNVESVEVVLTLPKPLASVEVCRAVIV